MALGKTGGQHLYRVKNTFVEHVDDDDVFSDEDQPARMRRSNSWSQSITSSSTATCSTRSQNGTELTPRSHDAPEAMPMPVCTVSLYPRGVESHPSSDETQQSSGSASARHINRSYIASLPRHSTRRAEEDFTEASHILFSSTTSDKTDESGSRVPAGESGNVHRGIAGKSGIPEFSSVRTPQDEAAGSDPLELHFKEMCKPCLRFILRDGCKDGDRCKYCHLVHPDTKKLRQRPCKLVRQQCKQVIQEVRDSHQCREKRLDELQSLVQPHSPYMRSLLMHTIKDLEDPAPTLHRVGQIATSSSLAPGSSMLVRDPTPAAHMPGLISTAAACGVGPQLPVVEEQPPAERTPLRRYSGQAEDKKNIVYHPAQRKSGGAGSHEGRKDGPLTKLSL